MRINGEVNSEEQRMASFAERLKELREEKKLKQEELGEIVGVSKDTIYRWENGKQQPKEEYVMLLAQYLNVSIMYLTGAIDERDIIFEDDETDERQTEEYLLSMYRRLSPDLKKMIQLTIASAYTVERERQQKHL